MEISMKVSKEEDRKIMWGLQHITADIYHRRNLHLWFILHNQRCKEEKDHCRCEVRLGHGQDSLMWIMYEEIKPLEHVLECPFQSSDPASHTSHYHF